MSKKEFFSRYLLILKKVQKNPYSSFEEIREYVSQELDLNGELKTDFSKRTFQRDIIEILSLFNIEILYQRTEQGYYIANDTNNDAYYSRMMEAYDVFQSFNQLDSLKSFFHFEKRRPLGTDLLKPIIQAIKNRYFLHFIYHKDWQMNSKRIIEPLVLKEYKSRWYLVGIEKGGTKIKTFALDRMDTLFATGEMFSLKRPFDAQEYFEHCFGIYRPNDDSEKPQEIIFAVNKHTGNYLLSQPMHSSQKFIEETKENLIFQIFVFCTFDLKMELLSLGSNIQVISPESLQKELKEIHQSCLQDKTYL